MTIKSNRSRCRHNGKSNSCSISERRIESKTIRYSIDEQDLIKFLKKHMKR